MRKKKETPVKEKKKRGGVNRTDLQKKMEDLETQATELTLQRMHASCKRGSPRHQELSAQVRETVLTQRRIQAYLDGVITEDELNLK